MRQFRVDETLIFSKTRRQASRIFILLSFLHIVYYPEIMENKTNSIDRIKFYRYMNYIGLIKYSLNLT